jgi:histidinol-phosphate aminotransferase
MGYERKQIAAMQGYVPGKQPASADTIKLNTNENPYPPAPEVLAALGAIAPDALRRYPPPTAQGLRALAAQVHGVAPENIVAVNGGDELLRLVLTTFVEPGTPIGVVEPSYSLYPVLAQIHGSPVFAVDARDDYALPPDLAGQMQRAGVSLLLVVNPQAPSGRLSSVAEIDALVSSFPGVVLVDEAYVDFVDPELGHDLVPLIAKHDNLLLLRTFSKGYSLAGLRVGYGIGAPSLIEPVLWKTRDSYNLDAIAQRLAETSLAQRAYAQETWRKVRQERARVSAELRALGFEVPASQTNFVLAAVPAGQDARALHQKLEAGGILVRHFALPRIDRSLRITIGTREQNDKLLALLRAAL